MCIYIYIYRPHDYDGVAGPAGWGERLRPRWLREDLRTGYGLRFSTEANGRKRFSTNTYRKLILFLLKSPKVSGDLREFTGECNQSRNPVFQLPLKK